MKKRKLDNSCKTPRWLILKSQLNNISPDELKKLSHDKRYRIIDVRTENEYVIGHIPKAINMDYLRDDFLEQLDMLKREFSYIIYCRSGRRSLRVCTWMVNGGFNPEKIFNLDGGYMEWITSSNKA